MVEIGYTLCSEEHGVHQIGPDQEGFFRFCEREIIPKLGEARRSRKAA